MLKITGLDELTKDLREAGKALSALNGTIATLEFDPSDPGSISAAIAQMERAIDRKVARYRRNPLVATLTKDMKKIYRKAIRDRANQRAQAKDSTQIGTG